MDWMTTIYIILGIFGVTVAVSLFLPKNVDAQTQEDNRDGPVIPVPGADGSVMGVGRDGDGGDEDYDPDTDDWDGDQDLVN